MNGLEFLSSIDIQSVSPDISGKWQGCKVSASEDYPPPVFTLNIGGAGSLSRGDFVAVKAQAKSGKSFACSILSAAVLGNADFAPRGIEKGASVVYFDTEQAKGATAQMVRRIHRLLGWNTRQDNGKLQVFNLREFDVTERLEAIEDITNALRPTVVVVDGIVVFGTKKRVLTDVYTFINDESHS